MPDTVVPHSSVLLTVHCRLRLGAVWPPTLGHTIVVLCGTLNPQPMPCTMQETEGAYGAWLADDVVCHETAHQWFGNLVTTQDWAQLTVNEGVASFMEYKCVEAAFPYMPARPLFFR